MTQQGQVTNGGLLQPEKWHNFDESKFDHQDGSHLTYQYLYNFSKILSTWENCQTEWGIGC